MPANLVRRCACFAAACAAAQHGGAPSRGVQVRQNHRLAAVAALQRAGQRTYQRWGWGLELVVGLLWLVHSRPLGACSSLQGTCQGLAPLQLPSASPGCAWGAGDSLHDPNSPCLHMCSTHAAHLTAYPPPLQSFLASAVALRVQQLWWQAVGRGDLDKLCTMLHALDHMS